MRTIGECPKCHNTTSISFDTFRGVIRCTVFTCGWVGPRLTDYYRQQAAADWCEKGEG